MEVEIMEEKAQGAIEYLLIIGAAILVVAIVILMMTGIISGDPTSDANQALTDASSDLNAQVDNFR
jgi:uncharacterized protein (UPF0333 family)